MRESFQQFVRQLRGARNVYLGGLAAIDAEAAQQHGAAILAARRRHGGGGFGRGDIARGRGLDRAHI